MSFLSQRLSALLHDESGQDTIEYALVAAFLGLAAVTSFKNLANAVKAVFNNVGTILTTAT